MCSAGILKAYVCLALGALLRVNADCLDLSGANEADDPSMLRTALAGRQVHCPPCEQLFTKLGNVADGARRQESHLVLKGEPKSGTTFMYSWAVGILMHTCERLQDTYGLKSCRTERVGHELQMIFEPKLSDRNASCPCDEVERVEVSISANTKHLFPVQKSCPWYHRNGIPRDGEGCWMVGGRAVENVSDLWGCMQEASCDFNDHRQQFVAMRDPRAVAVSTYFYVRTHPRYYEDHYAQNHTLDETVMKILPQVSHLTALRHILFDGIVADRSEIFWYKDALEDPLDWHRRWMSLAGLLLPKTWIEYMVASIGMDTWASKVNPHPGGEEVSVNRTWMDEVSPDIREGMDATLRTWLPGVLLARFEVPY